MVLTGWSFLNHEILGYDVWYGVGYGIGYGVGYGTYRLVVLEP